MQCRAGEAATDRNNIFASAIHAITADCLVISIDMFLLKKHTFGAMLEHKSLALDHGLGWGPGVAAKPDHLDLAAATRNAQHAPTVDLCPPRPSFLPYLTAGRLSSQFDSLDLQCLY